jgi:2-phospho-L-lactate guanylyltransferase
MQATVSRYDASTRDGAVLLDDGVELTFDADALAGSGLRLLRSGQRVRLEVSDDPHAAGGRRIERLQILTLA